jgi:hypothetical protein
MQTKTLFISLVMLWAGITANCQSFSSAYTYDANGNRITTAVIYLTTTSRMAKIPITQITNDSTTLADSVNVPRQGWDKPVTGPLSGFQINVYPNPTHGVLMLEVSGTGTQLSGIGNVITVWDLQGKQAMSPTLLKNTNLIDFSQKANGTYLLKISINGQTKDYKIIKE